MSPLRRVIAWCGCLWLVCAAGCRSSATAVAPESLVRQVRDACAKRDVGAVMTLVDLRYADDLGGPGRLQDDLKQLFAVYGNLDLHISDLFRKGFTIQAFAVVRGRSMRFEGPIELELVDGSAGWLIRSGLLTDLRGVLNALRQRRIAVERGSLERMDAVVSMEYAGETGGRERLMERLREAFQSTRDTALIVDELDVAVERDRARVTQSYLLVTHVEQRTIERRDRERLILRKEGTRWRIIDGLG